MCALRGGGGCNVRNKERKVFTLKREERQRLRESGDPKCLHGSGCSGNKNARGRFLKCNDVCSCDVGKGKKHTSNYITHVSYLYTNREVNYKEKGM